MLCNKLSTKSITIFMDEYIFQGKMKFISHETSSMCQLHIYTTSFTQLSFVNSNIKENNINECMNTQ